MLSGPANGAALLQSSTLTLVSPTACPAAGCAPGQRMNLRYDFELANYDPTLDPAQPNVKVCFYAPTDWIDSASLNTGNQTGGVTGQPYTPIADCNEDTAPPGGYSLVAGWQSAITTFAFSDSLNLSFRIAKNATSPV